MMIGKEGLGIRLSLKGYKGWLVTLAQVKAQLYTLEGGEYAAVLYQHLPSLER
jgi:hypothetical protein